MTFDNGSQWTIKEFLQRQSLAVEAEVGMWRESIAAQMLAQKLLSQNPSSQDGREAQNLSDVQLRLLTDKLIAWSDAYHIEIDSAALRALPVSNAGLLVLKKHFPGRMVVPLSLPLENLVHWQEKVKEAFSFLEKAVKLTPTDTQLLYNLSGGHALDAQYEKSRQILEQLYKIDPNFPEAAFLKRQVDSVLARSHAGQSGGAVAAKQIS